MAKSVNKTKTMWQIIKRKTNKSSIFANKNIKLKTNNETFVSPTKVANIFNNYFSSIGTESRENQSKN